jgi:hypothetical protein
VIVELFRLNYPSEDYLQGQRRQKGRNYSQRGRRYPKGNHSLRSLQTQAGLSLKWFDQRWQFFASD